MKQAFVFWDNSKICISAKPEDQVGAIRPAQSLVLTKRKMTQ